MHNGCCIQTLHDLQCVNQMQGFPKETNDPIERVISPGNNDADGPKGLISRTRSEVWL